MKINERIEIIKRLLNYCPHSTVDVKIIEERVGSFFGKFFNGDERFNHCHYSRDKIYPRISLHEEVMDGYKDCSTIHIEYCYDFDRDGEYWTGYYFNDPTMLRYYRRYDFMKPRVLIDYNEVPDYIWEIIQGELYEIATKSIKEGLESAKASVEYWKKRKEEFDNGIGLRREG